MARKRKQKPVPRARTGPWDALGISSSTYYRRQRAEKRAKHDKQPPKPLDFDRAGFLQDQLKETNKAATQAIYGDGQTHKLTVLDTPSQVGGGSYRGETITFVDGPSPVDGRVKVPLTEEQTLEVDIAIRDAANTALVEQFLWEVERYRDGLLGQPLPRDWRISGRMADALYNVLKDGKGE